MPTPESRVEGFEAYNLGSERGFSVKEVIETCRRVTGQDIRYRLAGLRAGAAGGERVTCSRGVGVVTGIQ